MKKKKTQPFHRGLITILKMKLEEEKLMKKKKKKSESTGLTHQIRLTRQT